MKRTAPIALFTLAAVATGCTGGSRALLQAEVVRTYAQIVHASYEDSHSAAVLLQAAIFDFVASPTQEGLERARSAWLAARDPYGQTEAYRFGGGPIDRAGGPEPLINAWPLDEAYIDYVEGSPESGIINSPDLYPEIDRELLVSLNESGAEENISVGFHAIEFLLWGQDLSADGPGNRPYTDYVSGAAPNAERRGRYLTIAAELLVERLGGLVEEWAPDQAGNYRSEFTSGPPDVAVRSILAGVGVLSKSELSGERLFTAYDNQDQEDEHSCFSDNTHRDIAMNFRGIGNVLEGSYTRADGTEITGTGVLELVRAVDPGLATRIEDLVRGIRASMVQFPAPFDRAIVEPDSRPAVLDLVYRLQDLGDQIAVAGSALGLTINTALPD